MRNSFHFFINAVVDTCFPPSKDALSVRALTSEDMRQLYTPILHPSGIWILSRYRDPRMTALIHEAKFEGNKVAATHLATLFERFIEEHGELKKALWLPIPLSAPRLRERGYNQVERVLRAITNISLLIRSDALIRTRDTKPQAELTKEERLGNVAGAFKANAELLRDMPVVIVDDVLTTGATLKAAADAVRAAHPFKMTIIALAH